VKYSATASAGSRRISSADRSTVCDVPVTLASRIRSNCTLSSVAPSGEPSNVLHRNPISAAALWFFHNSIRCSSGTSAVENATIVEERPPGWVTRRLSAGPRRGAGSMAHRSAADSAAIVALVLVVTVSTTTSAASTPAVT
jgi:hypothetical protein